MKPASQGGLRVHAAKLHVWCLRSFIHSFTSRAAHSPTTTTGRFHRRSPRRKERQPSSGRRRFDVTGPAKAARKPIRCLFPRLSPGMSMSCRPMPPAMGIARLSSPSALGCTPGTPGTSQSCLFSPVACHHQLLSVPSQFTADIWTCTQQEPFRHLQSTTGCFPGESGRSFAEEACDCRWPRPSTSK